MNNFSNGMRRSIFLSLYKGRSFAKMSNLKNSDYLKMLLDFKPKLLNELIISPFPENTPNYVKNLFKEAVNYNTKGGKLARGVAVIANLYHLNPNPTEKMLEQALILGWMIEILQACFLVLDDVQDQSETRRGSLCWYKVPGIGYDAVNDGLLMELTIFELIRKIFATHPSYMKLSELFISVCYKTSTGQALDLSLSKMGQKSPCDFTEFNYMSYKSMVSLKTTQYSFVLPFLAAAYLVSPTPNADLIEKSLQVLENIGHLFQLQDDYLDLYGDPKVTGKIGTDIQDGKCSWLVVTFLRIASDKDKSTLLHNYGKLDPNCIEEVKRLFTNYKIQELYLNTVETLVKDLNAEIPAKMSEPFASYYLDYLASMKFRCK